MNPKHSATRVDGGWAYYDQAGREIERRTQSAGYLFISGILGPLEPQRIAVSIPFDPAVFPRRRKAKQ